MTATQTRATIAADILTTFREMLATYEEQREALRGVLVGENKVVRTYGGLYVVRDGEGYRPGDISRAIRWNAQGAAAMAAHWNANVKQPEAARVVGLHQSLDEEIANLKDQIALIERTAVAA